MAKKKARILNKPGPTKRSVGQSATPTLKMVRLLESSSKLRIESGEFPKGFEIGMNIQLKNAENGEGERVVSLISLKAKGEATGTEILITASYELAYSTPPMSDEQIEGFQKTVAADAWPYLAEFLRSISGRMMIAPIHLPPLDSRDISTAKAARKKRRTGKG